MRYHFTKSGILTSMYGELYQCNHPVYDRCTLFKIGDDGLAVIQQRFDKSSKRTYWTEIDKELNDSIYLNDGFFEYFLSRARKPVDGVYPTVTIRQVMWSLRMKPLKREAWETTFDRREV